MFLTSNHICPNNLLRWQFVTKPQQKKKKNEHMREVINHSTHIHLLNTIKSILTQTLEKICNQEEKNTNMNAIKHAIQPMIQTTF